MKILCKINENAASPIYIAKPTECSTLDTPKLNLKNIIFMLHQQINIKQFSGLSNLWGSKLRPSSRKITFASPGLLPNSRIPHQSCALNGLNPGFIAALC